MGQYRTLDRRFGPGDGRGILSGLVRGHGDVVMLADAMARLCQSSDALLDVRQLLLRAGFAQPGGEFGETGLEACHEARGDRGFLGLASLGMTIKPDFRAVLAEDALEPDRFI